MAKYFSCLPVVPSIGTSDQNDPLLLRQPFVVTSIAASVLSASNTVLVHWGISVLPPQDPSVVFRRSNTMQRLGADRAFGTQPVEVEPRPRTRIRTRTRTRTRALGLRRFVPGRGSLPKIASYRHLRSRRGETFCRMICNGDFVILHRVHSERSRGEAKTWTKGV